MARRKEPRNHSAWVWVTCVILAVSWNIGLASAFTSLFPGVAFAGTVVAPVQDEEKPLPPPPVVAPLASLPAVDALAEITTADAATLLGDGWSTDTGAAESTVRGGAVEALCGSPTATRPVLGSSGTYRRDGAPPLHVRFAVHGAGLGGVAFEEHRRTGRACGALTRSGAAQVGVEATVGTFDGGEAISVVTWRRGDVIAEAFWATGPIVTLAGAVAAPEDLGGGRLYVAPRERIVLAELAARVDVALSDALAERCVTQDSPAEIAGRSPYGTNPYTGHTRSMGVEGPALLFLPTPEEQAPAAIQEYDEAYEDPATVPVPEPLVRRAPRLPTEPEPPATNVTVVVPQMDPEGPGCGWDFTGQQRPLVDESSIAVERERIVSEAQRRLGDGAAAHIAAQVSYNEKLTTYWSESNSYSTYRAYTLAVANAEEALARRIAASATTTTRPPATTTTTEPTTTTTTVPPTTTTTEPVVEAPPTTDPAVPPTPADPSDGTTTTTNPPLPRADT